MPVPTDVPAPEEPSDALAPTPSHPYVRTAVETTLFLAGATVWYWRHPSYSDWDLNFDWQSWKSKLFSDRQIVFDDNLFNTNGSVHPAAGAVYYQIARGNGLGPGASLLASFLASTAWEYFAEFNEKPSTNDLILTPAAGAVIGEAGYRLGRFFAAGEPNIANCIGAVLFSPVATLNDSAVCRQGRGEPPFDGAGFTRQTWHRLAVEIGWARSVFDGANVTDETTFALYADVITHRPYGRPGEGSTTVRPGQWTAISSTNLIGEARLRGTWFHTQTMLWGRYLRRYSETTEGLRGRPDGWGAMVGLGSTFDYDSRDLPGGWDRTASAGILGPMLDFATRRGAFALRAELSAQYGFTMIQSLVYPEAAPAFANDFVKSELRQQGYYYAHGLTSLATLALDAGDFELRLSGRTTAVWSINQDDRFQGMITNNFALSDTRVFLRAAAAARPFGGPVRVALAFDQVSRGSHLPGYAFQSDERRAGLSTFVVF